MFSFELSTLDRLPADIFESSQIDAELQKIDINLTQDMFKECALGVHYLLQDKFLYDRNSLGSILQAEFTNLLRQRLLPYGWELKDWAGGVYLTVSPCKSKCIIVATGTPDVGKPQSFPSTTARKGKMWEEAIRNSKLELPEVLEFWVLLIHRKDNYLQMELSKPSDFVKSYPTGYTKRILLQNAYFGIEFEVEHKQESAEAHQPVVERKRKAV